MFMHGTALRQPLAAVPNKANISSASRARMEGGGDCISDGKPLQSRRVAKALLIVTVGCVAILSGGDARAQAASDPLRDGIAAYNGLEYERALPLLEAALKETLTRDERLTALRTVAQAQFALGREPETRAALDRLLRVDPGYELNRKEPPRLRQLLEEMRHQLATRPPPQASDTVNAGALPAFALEARPAAPHEGQAVTFRLADPGRDAPRLAVYHRGASGGSFALVEGRRDARGVYEATVPGAAVHAPRLEYFALLLDGAGTPSARAGTLGGPLELGVAPGRRPLYKRAWFWGTIAGVAAAGAIAAVLAVELPRRDASVALQPH
jgi:hypothetical protein